jgi:hypothetical protein
MQLDLGDEETRALLNVLIEAMRTTAIRRRRPYGCCAGSSPSSARWGYRRRDGQRRGPVSITRRTCLKTFKWVTSVTASA